MADQLRLAADIIEHDLKWSGVRTMHGSGDTQVVGSGELAIPGIGPVEAIVNLGYTIKIDGTEMGELCDCGGGDDCELCHGEGVVK